MTEHLPTDFRSRSIGDYVRALSSADPTPGGGSAAGLTGALGCSLGEMVCNLTLTKVNDDNLTSFAGIFANMANDLISLARRDELAFGAYRAAIALPRLTDDEKLVRRAAIEQSLITAAEVPLEMVDIGLTAIDCLRKTAELGTAHALGDLMTGGFLLQAMTMGSLENVAVNAASMKSPEHRERFEKAVHSASRDLEIYLGALQHAVAERNA